MKETQFFVVLYDKNNKELHRSVPSDEYPDNKTIEFGLGYKGVDYAKVEKVYRLN